MMLRRASPLGQELPGCHFLPPAAAFSRSSIEHSAVVQQTEPGINVAATQINSTLLYCALCVQLPRQDAVQCREVAMCSEAVILW